VRAWVRVAPFTLATAIAVAPAHADPRDWITVRAPSRCDAAAAELAERVNRALVARPAPELRASVVIEAMDSGYEVTLRTARGSQSLGTKVLSVPTCDEAVDAAVVVLALALSEEASAERRAPDDDGASSESVADDSSLVAPAVSAPPAGTTHFEPNRSAARRSDRPSHRASRADEARNASRISLLTGVDAGTLPVPTAQIGLGVARTFERVEVRGTARYGLPYEEEELDGGRTERQRHEFGAAGLDACYRLGTGWTLAGCAGGEVGVVLSEHRLDTEAGLAVESTRAPRLSGVTTLLVAHRRGIVQPELELSSAVVVAGRAPDAALLTLRAAVGVAMQF
jgi:hypothetical protein